MYSTKPSVLMWTPDHTQLEQLRLIFKGTLLLHRTERTAANDALAGARKDLQFENYLCELLVHDSAATSDVRAAAGVNLKNSVSKSPKAERPHVLAAIFDGLAVTDTLVRNITGSVITALFAARGVETWPDALPRLLAAVEDPELAAGPREAAVLALAKICEDNLALLDRPYHGERPLDHVAARMVAVAALDASPPAIRAQAVFCVTQLLMLQGALASTVLDGFLPALFALAANDDASVRQNVCRAFSLVLEVYPDRLLSDLAHVVDYCVHQVQTRHETVAMDACEVLLGVAELPLPGVRSAFLQSVRTVVPVLLAAMVYSSDDVALYELRDTEDVGIADRADDIRPAAAKSRLAHGVTHKSDSQADQDADSDTDADSDDSDAGEWNLRRCAALTLDALALVHPQAVLDAALPVLELNIVSDEWPVREAAILAFGAVAQSCMDLASDRLPILVPFLAQRMADPESKVREILCWTLSKYAAWICGEVEHSGSYASYYGPALELVVQLGRDSRKAVQNAACLALSTFLDNSKVESVRPYSAALCTHFAACLASYQHRNMLMLYDCITTFVDKLSSDFPEECAQTLLPPLLANWQRLDDDDAALWPLLECMSAVAAAMGESFAPYAVPVYNRALKILGSVLINPEVATHPDIDTPEMDFAVTALDLVDGLVQGFKRHFVDLAAQNTTQILPLVAAALENDNDDVRQLAYALLGDLVIHVYDVVAPHANDVVVCIGHELASHNYFSYAVTNNAVWVCGELALVADPAVWTPHLANLVGVLIAMMNLPETHQSVLENAAICLGRFGLAGGAPVVAPRLAEFIYPWCSHMMYLAEDHEKETAFLGMVRHIEANPNGGFGGLANQQGRKNLAVFVGCVGSYFEPSERLREAFFQLLGGYKTLLGDAWETQVLGLVDAESRGFLLTTYGI